MGNPDDLDDLEGGTAMQTYTYLIAMCLRLQKGHVHPQRLSHRSSELRSGHVRRLQLLLRPLDKTRIRRMKAVA